MVFVLLSECVCSHKSLCALVFIVPVSSAMLNMDTMNGLLSLPIFDFLSPILCVLPLILGAFFFFNFGQRRLLVLQGTWLTRPLLA